MNHKNITHKPVTACLYLKDKTRADKPARWHVDITYTDPRTDREVRVRRVAPDGLTLEGSLKWGEDTRLRMVTDLARPAATDSEKAGAAEKKSRFPTLAEIWPDFESAHIDEQKHSTRKNFDIAWRLHLQDLKDTRIDLITEQTLGDLRRSLKKKSLGLQTQRKVVEHAQTALKWARSEGKLPRAHVIPVLKWAPRVKGYMDVYSREDLERLLGAAKKIKDRALVLLLIDGALRIGEPAALAWADIDLVAGTMTIRRNVCKRVLQDSTKGGKAATLPLSHRLRTALAELREITGGSPWLLPRRSGANTTDRALGNRIRDLQVRAGIPCWGPHRIRHSVLTLAARAGATPYALQKWARHSAMKTTMDYYVHLDNGLAVEAIACVAGPTAVSTSGNATVTGGNVS